MSTQKPILNGMDSHAPAGGGFRHQLPQMPVMSRNPKIAQSKGSSKEEIGTMEHSTVDVEGVGKVVHIGSNLMEIEESAEEKLLKELEENCTEPDINENEDKPINGSNAEQNKENKNNASKPEEETVEPMKQIEKIEKLADEEGGESKETAGNVDDKSGNNKDTNEAADSEETKPEEESKRGRRRSSAVKHVKETIASPPSSKKPRQSGNQTQDSGKTVVEESAVSPGSKRLRKPKKMEMEEKEVPKSPKVKPAQEKTKSKSDDTAELENKFPVKWLVGDLVWAKVVGHPWWPCMISYDPYIALYTRITDKKGSGREYHVQFFGDAAERGWIPMKNLIEFQGKAKFDEHVEEVYKNAKSSMDKKKLKKWYGITPGRVNAVNVGVASAEEALVMSRNERKATYTFVYNLSKGRGKELVSIPDEKKADELAEDVKLIKAAQEGVSTPEIGKGKGKKRKFDEASTPEARKSSAKRQKIETTTSVSPSKSAKKATTPRRMSGTEASFEVFCQKERDSVLSEHPDFNEDTFLDFCRQQWCRMSKQQKARYKSKFSDEKKTVIRPDQDRSPPVSPTRNRKPSKKLMEAEEDNKLVDEAILNTASEKKTNKGQTKRQSVPSSPSKGRKQAVEEPEEIPKKPRRKSRVSEVPETKPEVESTEKDCLQTKAVEEPEEVSKKPRRKSRVSEAPETKPEVELTEKDGLQTGISGTLMPKKSRSRKSTTETEIQSLQSDSGRSTPTLPECQLPPKKEKEEFEYEPEIYKLSSTGPSKKENLCQICEQTGDLLECQGSCHGYFHLSCLGISKAPSDSFKCDECTNGIHSCFVCKKSEVNMQKCSTPLCGKFYHMDCVKDLPQTKVEGKSFQCPLHVCHTCMANNTKMASGRSNGRLIRCIRCPTAYHVGDFCMSAGSIQLTGFNIVCAKHFQPIPSQKHHSHVNVSWCFNCNKGGTLLCCESCPAAFHAECLKIEFPSGSWYCPDCMKGKRPLYGELIWVKLGNYRWWPGEICHPRNVPHNIQEKPHQVGEFPVHFLGSHDYFWLHQGRVFSFQEGDKGNTNFQSAKGLKKHFSKGLLEATEAYKIWKEFKDNKEQLEEERLKKKPAPFRMVKTNVPVGNVTINKADLSELHRCECKAENEDPCGMSSNCLNHMMMYECHPALCPVGEKCRNQFFTKRLYPDQRHYKTEGRGWGLQALVDIRKGEFVNEYVGDLIDEEECKRRLEKAHENDVSNFYMMTLDADRIIDAGPKGNLSRFMNHSCQPNLETQKWTVNGDVRVGLFALTDIKSGDELTFNYNFDCFGNEKTKCCCGAENCSGYLSVRPKTQAAAMAEAKKKDSKMSKVKKKKKVAVKRKHEDDCFRCGEGGELVMCDRSSCPKSYHLGCLGLDKPPYGKWDCPWHHCDECGKPASRMCAECPNSFCGTHSETNTKNYENKVYCMEHDELLQTLSESQSQASTTSDEISDSELENGNGTTKDKNKDEKSVGENSKAQKSEKNSKVKNKEEKAPPKKRGQKQSVEKNTKANGNGASEKGSKGSKGKKGSGKGASGTKGPLSDDPLAVAPMFDDSEEEEFGLVIDIPNF